MYSSNKYANLFIRELILAFLMFICALNFNIFIKPVGLVTGGTGGLALVLCKMFPITTDQVIYGVYIICFILGAIFLGKESVLDILVASISYPVFTSITGSLSGILEIDSMFMITITSLIISAISNGFIYKLGYPNSGLGVIGPILNKYFNIPISTVNMILNLSMLTLGGYYYGLTMVMYAIMFIYVSSILTDYVILSSSTHNTIVICSNKIDEINKEIHKKYNRELDLIDSVKDNMGAIIIKKTEFRKYTKLIEEIDKDCFYDVLDSYELIS